MGMSAEHAAGWPANHSKQRGGEDVAALARRLTVCGTRGDLGPRRGFRML